MGYTGEHRFRIWIQCKGQAVSASCSVETCDRPALFMWSKKCLHLSPFKFSLLSHCHDATYETAGLSWKSFL